MRYTVKLSTDPHPLYTDDKDDAIRVIEEWLDPFHDTQGAAPDRWASITQGIYYEQYWRDTSNRVRSMVITS